MLIFDFQMIQNDAVDEMSDFSCVEEIKPSPEVVTLDD